ncbi:MAG: hypothetical protein U0R68_13415 [Candidatus Nanopelagicales bacterium]
MIDPTVIDEALRRMDDRHLRVATAALIKKARVDDDAWVPLWHALAVAMAEETDRRRDILAALDPDLDDQTVGEIVDDAE